MFIYMNACHFICQLHALQCPALSLLRIFGFKVLSNKTMETLINYVMDKIVIVQIVCY